MKMNKSKQTSITIGRKRARNSAKKEEKKNVRVSFAPRMTEKKRNLVLIVICDYQYI